MTANTIGGRIAALRKTRGLTQEQLGSALGVTGQAVSKWENGDSLPDILLLPALCKRLGTSADALLDDSGRAGASESDRTRALITSAVGSFSDNGANASGQNASFGAGSLRTSDGGGMCFAATADYMESCLSRGGDAAYFLRAFADESAIRLLAALSISRALSVPELCETSGIDEAETSRVLPELVERGIICVGTDADGKRGYLRSHNMAGVHMALAGALASNFGGEITGNLWFSRGSD